MQYRTIVLYLYHLDIEQRREFNWVLYKTGITPILNKDTSGVTLGLSKRLAKLMSIGLYDCYSVHGMKFSNTGGRNNVSIYSYNRGVGLVPKVLLFPITLLITKKSADIIKEYYTAIESLCSRHQIITQKQATLKHFAQLVHSTYY